MKDKVHKSRNMNTLYCLYAFYIFGLYDKNAPKNNIYIPYSKCVWLYYSYVKLWKI